jgi:hypothetical protein
MDLRKEIERAISSVNDELPNTDLSIVSDKIIAEYKKEEMESVINEELVGLQNCEDSNLQSHLYSSIIRLEATCKKSCDERYKLLSDESGDIKNNTLEKRVRLNGSIIAQSLIKNGMITINSMMAKEEFIKNNV